MDSTNLSHAFNVTLDAKFEAKGIDQLAELAKSFGDAGKVAEEYEKEIDRLGSALQRTRSDLERVSSELDNFKGGNGIRILEEELERFRTTANTSQREFKAFLESARLDDVYGSNSHLFSDYFREIQEGSITASEAIAKVKVEFRDMLSENAAAGGGLFDSQMVEGFIIKLDQLAATITDVAKRIRDIETNGVKAAGGGSGGVSGNVADMMRQIEAAASGMSAEAKEAFAQIQSLVEAMTTYANVDETKLLGVSQAFRNIADTTRGNFGEKSVKNIITLTNELSKLSASGASMRFDFTGFNELKVSKASLNNLATYLPLISKVNFEKLQKISQVNFSNFNNLSISKGAIEGVNRLADAMERAYTVAEKASKAGINIFGSQTISTAASGGSGSSGGGGGKTGGTGGGLESLNDKTAESLMAKMARAATQANNLINKNMNASQAASFDKLVKHLAIVRDILQQANGDVNAFKMAIDGVDADVLVTTLSSATATVKDELTAMGKVGTTSLDQIISTATKMNDAMKAHGDMADTSAYANLKNVWAQFDAVIQECNGDTSKFAQAMQNAGLDGANAIKQAVLAMAAFNNEVKKQDSGINSKNEKLVAGTKAYADSLKQVSTAIAENKQKARNWTAASVGNTADAYESYVRAGEKLVKLQGLLEAGKLTPEQYAVAYRNLTTTMAQSAAEIERAGKAHQSFGDRLKGVFTQLTYYFGASRIIMEGIRAIKEAAKISKELDMAFAQLKIVTGATDLEMAKFKDTAVSMAQELGKSVTDVTGSIEVFSRLGYNLGDASQLAQYATILSNVASTTAEESTTGLTSIIKGYNMDVQNTEHVADVLVEVGQKYAVSASEMMTAFEKSGAALNATNTSFEKSAGLIAAANAAVECCRAA